MAEDYNLGYIEAPYNTFPSQMTGPSGETVYWAPAGSLYPVIPDGIGEQKIKELFDEATLFWADDYCPVGYDEYEAAFESENGLDGLKQKAFDKGIPFISISSMPLGEEYFSNKYHICYFASKPYKVSKNTFITVGVIGP